MTGNPFAIAEKLGRKEFLQQAVLKFIESTGKVPTTADIETMDRAYGDCADYADAWFQSIREGK